MNAIAHDRNTGIGSSDADAAIGQNPYVTPIELWQEKTGEAPPFLGNEATRWGQLLEPAVRQEYSERTGRQVRLPPGAIHSLRYGFMYAHPDGVTDCGRLYEGKTARYPDGWGDPGSDQIPAQYLIQVQHAMIVLALPVADVAVLIGGQDFRMYEVPADPELQQMIIDAEANFWQCVVKRTPPPIDFEAPGALELIKRLYPGTDGTTVVADAGLERWRLVYEEADSLQKNYQAAADAAKAHLLHAMGKAAVLKFDDGRVLRRKLISKKPYTVDATSYVDARFANSKE